MEINLYYPNEDLLEFNPYELVEARGITNSNKKMYLIELAMNCEAIYTLDDFVFACCLEFVMKQNHKFNLYYQNKDGYYEKVYIDRLGYIEPKYVDIMFVDIKNKIQNISDLRLQILEE